MRKLISVALVVAVVLALTCAAAMAQRELTVEPVQPGNATGLNLGPSQGLVSCQVGNLNAAAFALFSFLTPPEDYKLLFLPSATCTACPAGFSVTKIHVYLQTKTACQVVLSVDVEDAVLQSPGCYAPGPVRCQTALYNVSLPSAGLWNVGITVAPAECTPCACLAAGRRYLLSVHFQSMTCTSANIALITDAGPAVLCTNWNNYGPGWYDLLGAFPGWPGQLKFFADADCCSPPTPVEDSAWGRVKSLFR